MQQLQICFSVSNVLVISSPSDPDECSDPNSNDCHANAICTNTPGSYECKCDDGYEGDGVTCGE